MSDDFNLYDLFMNCVPEEVKQAHELRDSEREPYIEEYNTGPLTGQVFASPFRVTNDSYTVY